MDQYNDCKFAVAEKIKSTLILNVHDMVTLALQSEQFKAGGYWRNLFASGVDCERGL